MVLQKQIEKKRQKIAYHLVKIQHQSKIKDIKIYILHNNKSFPVVGILSFYVLSLSK